MAWDQEAPDSVCFHTSVTVHDFADEPRNVIRCVNCVSGLQYCRRCQWQRMGGVEEFYQCFSLQYSNRQLCSIQEHDLYFACPYCNEFPCDFDFRIACERNQYQQSKKDCSGRFVHSLLYVIVSEETGTISVAVGGMLYTLLSNNGIVNQLIEKFGGTPVDWYSKADAWWLILALSSLWKGMGWATLVYISGLGAIDPELYDACTVDGGGRFRKMITVTIPGISEVIILQLILDIGHLLSDNYSQIIALTHGSTTLSSTLRVIGELNYTAMRTGDGLGRATAIGLVQSFFGLILMLAANWIAKKTDHEGVL